MVLLGPLADIARDQLLDQYPDQFELPRKSFCQHSTLSRTSTGLMISFLETHLQSSTKACATIIKLQSIKDVIQKVSIRNPQL